MSEQTRILIVEDEIIIAMDLQATLCEAGYVVIATVPSGEEALALCVEERPDLVLMDVHLQGVLNGIETAQQLRECHAIPSVLLTAHYDPVTLTAAQHAGVFAYLIKPYDQRELCATLATALARARSESDLQRQLQEFRSTSQQGGQGRDHKQVEIFTLCVPLTMKYQGKILRGDLFPRTQREMLALLLASPALRMESEVLTAELWPDSPSKQARASFDATLMRLRRLVTAEMGHSVGMELFSLKGGIVAIENCAVDLHHFDALDAEGCARRRSGDEPGAINSFLQAVTLWQGEFLAGLSSHHDVLTVRQYNTQRVFEVAQWLAGIFALQQRPEEQAEALQLALRAIPSSEKAMAALYHLLFTQNREELAKAFMADFIRELNRDGLHRQEINSIVRRIEQQVVHARYSPSPKS